MKRYYALKLRRISDGPLGERLWWFGTDAEAPNAHVRICRVPASHSTSGKREYRVEFLPTPGCMRSRYEQAASWPEARHIVADPWGTQA